MSKRIGILTGGGDCPGLNAVIRAATRRSIDLGHSVIGVKEGWRGMTEGIFEPLEMSSISGLLHRGGTVLRTSRTNPFNVDGGLEATLRNMQGLDALIAIGGEDTLGVAARLAEEYAQPIVGVPKTIDNDLSGTDTTFGFDSALTIATEAIDRLHSTAESHNRVMVCEVMGRHAGWIALHAGIAGGADVTLLPEFPLSVERTAELIRHRHARGKDFSIIVVSEGWPMTHEAGSQAMTTVAEELDAFGHVRLGGIGNQLAEELERLTGFETRVTVLGHVQRGGTPTAFDRVLATRYGLLAAELVDSERWGMMTALRGEDVIPVSLREATAELKTVPRERYDQALQLMG